MKEIHTNLLQTGEHSVQVLLSWHTKLLHQMVRFYIWLLQQVYLISIEPRSYMVINDNLRGDWLTEFVNSQIWYCQLSLEYQHFCGMRIWEQLLGGRAVVLWFNVFINTHNTRSHGKWFPHNCTFVRRIHWLLVNSPQKGTALVFSLLTWTTCWTDGWIAGDFKHQGTHVTSLHCLFQIFSADVVPMI